MVNILHIYQWRIQDFSQGGAPTPKSAIIFQFFAENCMKMKEFGPRGGRASLAPPLRSANVSDHNSFSSPNTEIDGKNLPAESDTLAAKIDEVSKLFSLI